MMVTSKVLDDKFELFCRRNNLIFDRFTSRKLLVFVKDVYRFGYQRAYLLKYKR